MANIVVALIDGHEATLKRFYRERDRIRLEPGQFDDEAHLFNQRPSAGRGGRPSCGSIEG